MPSTLRTSAARAPVMVLGAAATLVTLALAYRSRNWPLIHVPAQMHYLAWLFTEGAVPYRDVFDMNVPGSYLIHIALWNMFGESNAAFRAFDLCWLAATCIAVHVYARRVADVWSATAGAALFAIYHLADGASQAGERDFLLTVFLVVGMHAVARYVESGGSTSWLWRAGLALGAAVAIKPPPVLMLLAGAAAAALGARRIGRSSVRAFALVLAAGAVLPVLSFVWLWSQGGLAAFVDVYANYVVPLYRHVGRGSTAAAFSFSFYHLVPLLEFGLRTAREVRLASAMVICGTILAAMWLACRERFTLRHGLTMVGLAYGVINFVGQGKIWPYHMYPWVVFFCIAISMMLTSGIRTAHPFGARAYAALVTAVYALLVVGLTVRAVKGTEGLTTHNDIDAVNDLRHVEAIARDLKALVKPGDTVQQMDPHHMAIHSLLKARMREPSRFIYEFHFFHDVEDLRIQALRTEFMSALRSQPPAAMVMTPPDHRWLVGFPELSSFIEGGYAVAIDRNDYRIYLKRDKSNTLSRSFTLDR